MKIFYLIPFACLLLFTSCQDKEKTGYFTESSAEIDVMRQMIKDFENGDWDSYISHYSPTARIYHNRVNEDPRTIGETVDEHREFISYFSSYGFSRDHNQTVEMIVDSKGKKWVSFWGVLQVTFAESGENFSIILHKTSQFVDGKIVQEHAYWDTAPILLEIIKIDVITSESNI